jgi:hypothetical protein
VLALHHHLGLHLLCVPRLMLLALHHHLGLHLLCVPRLMLLALHHHLGLHLLCVPRLLDHADKRPHVIPPRCELGPEILPLLNSKLPVLAVVHNHLG